MGSVTGISAHREGCSAVADGSAFPCSECTLPLDVVLAPLFYEPNALQHVGDVVYSSLLHLRGTPAQASQDGAGRE